MSAAAILMMLGGIVFVEQDLPEARIGSPWLIVSDTYRNFRRADLDDDGASDLVFESHVVLQCDGVFSQEHRQELPEAYHDLPCDLWQGALYVRRPEGLTALRWAQGAWQEALVQSIEWPDNLAPDDEDEEKSEGPDEGDHSVRFERFLHDLDGDGTPEIVIPAPEGIVIYARKGDRYAKVRVLDVAPPVDSYGRSPLWPKDKRKLSYPRQWRYWWLLLEGNQLTVIKRRKNWGNDADGTSFGVTHYTLDATYAIVPGETRTHETERLPHWPRPMRLNNDDTIDFADWASLDGMRTAPMPTAVYETTVSTDGGKTSQTFRNAWMMPRGLFADFEGDGDMDMVFGATGVFRGGVRESVTRLATQRNVQHEIRVHLQDSRGRFSEQPDVRVPLTIRLDKPLVRRSAMAQRYANADLIDLSGDVDGDGLADLVVQDEPERLAVFLNSGAGFPKQPEATLATRADWAFSVFDVDCDGRSDIALRPESGGDDSADSRVFLTRGPSP